MVSKLPERLGLVPGELPGVGDRPHRERVGLIAGQAVEVRDQAGLEPAPHAGDWTRNGIDGGSVEAAVTSGMLAAQAISGEPRHVTGAADWLESDRGDAPA